MWAVMFHSLLLVGSLDAEEEVRDRLSVSITHDSGQVLLDWSLLWRVFVFEAIEAVAEAVLEETAVGAIIRLRAQRKLNILFYFFEGALHSSSWSSFWSCMSLCFLRALTLAFFCSELCSLITWAMVMRLVLIFPMCLR